MRFLTVSLLLTSIAAGCFGEMIGNRCKLTWHKWKNTITFNIDAQTNGWVGLGLNKDPSMKGADLVVAGLRNGKGYLYDMHGIGETMPLADANENYKLIWASENGTHTILSIRRDVQTGDVNDYQITDMPSFVLCAVGDQDAMAADNIKYHGPQNRAVKSLSLLKDMELGAGPPAVQPNLPGPQPTE